jgi:cytosine permease
MAIGVEDYALERTPQDARRPMWEVFLIRFGSICCLPMFMLGAALGFGLSFNEAILATFLGAVLLEVISCLIGIAGCREGLSTSVLTRWAGFGRIGSSLIGLIIAISLIGWFGIQNSIFAEGIGQALGGAVSVQVLMVITGLAVTALVVYGYRMLSYTANVAVPLFLVAVIIATIALFTRYNVHGLITTAAPGAHLTLGVAVTIVAGGYMVGAIISPDLSRFNRNGWDVFWSSLLSIFIGELGVVGLAVLMAHAVKSADVVSIMLSLGGWLAAGLVILGTVKINDINLYSSSLGLSNFFDTALNVRFSRANLTWIIGVLGTVASVIGILNRFVSFLTVLGVAIPPIGGIVVVDYFILKHSRRELDASRARNELPKTVEAINPVAILSWAIAFLVGTFVQQGIPALNSLLAAGVCYWVFMELYNLATHKKDAGLSGTISD